MNKANFIGALLSFLLGALLTYYAFQQLFLAAGCAPDGAWYWPIGNCSYDIYLSIAYFAGAVALFILGMRWASRVGA